jgi:polysaccharide chain length determinant protein (PEP-CTERM system associated)
MSSQMTGMVWQDYLEIILRRRWYVIVPFCLSVIVSVVLCFVMPKTYKSTTLIMVEQQKVPENYVKSTVSTDIDERLGNIQVQLTSRSLLQSVIDEFGLYKDEAKRMTPDELLDRVRKNVDVKVERGKKDIDAFSISYEGSDPKTVMQVTNKLASLFIEENLKVREEFVEGTSDFLDNELTGIKADLEAQENKIRQFKQQNMGELPEQTNANLRTLDRLQLEQQTVGDALSKAKELRAALLENHSKTAVSSPDREARDPLEALTPAQRLVRLQSELADLQTRFTDKYPDVIRVKGEIAELEKSLKANASGTKDLNTGKTKEGGPTKETVEADGALSYDFQGQLNQTVLEIRRLEERQKKIAEQMKSYEDRVEHAPLREQQMLALMRDYESTKAHYQSLLDKKLNARIAENLEKRQKGEQFHILDPATLPTKPDKPDLFRIVLMGFLVGLSSGGGAAFLREVMDNSFKRAEEVEAVLGLNVLASIPNIGETSHRPRKPPGIAEKLDPTVVTITEPVSLAAEQYRVVCAKLNKISKDQGPRVIAVMSSVKNEGKTLTSINLSASLAKDFNRRVLLIEADLKNPSLSRLLGHPMNGGLVNLLSLQTDLDHVGLTYFDDRLTVLPAGKSMGDDLRLLGSDQIREFLDQAKGRYDYVVLDIPPILPLADANVITGMADGLIMVIWAEHTPQHIVQRAIADLDSRKILGVVLNDVKSYMSHYYYYHHQKK